MDRFSSTTYKEEKKQLFVKDNNAYTQKKDGDAVLLEEKIKAEKPEWVKRRQEAYKNSSLPSSFSYKIRQAFHGEPCPICFSLMKAYEYSTNKLPTIQHNKPIIQGGEHELDNISVICKECNISIQDKETKPLNTEIVKQVWDAFKEMPVGTSSATQVKLSKVKLSKVKLSKKTHGEFENVLLDDEEYSKLCEVLTQPHTDNLIAELSTYMASKGKRYSNHYATLQNWARRKIQEHRTQITKKGKGVI